MSGTSEHTDITPNDSASNINGKRQKSVVWDHFSVCEDNESKVICRHCPKHKKFAYTNGGTTNLMKHLESQHKAKVNPSKRDPKQPRLDEMTISRAPLFSQDLFEEFLIDWVVGNNQPFREVESESFKRLLTLLKPGVTFMSRATLKRRIMDRFSSKAADMRFFFDNLDCRVSLTTDCWTSPNNIAFMGITAHYIDNDWVLRSVTLDFIRLPGSHTGENLYKAFVSVLEKYRLKDKAMGITLDNASNNDSFIDCLHLDLENSFDKYHHIRCFAHVLNLGAQAALSVIKVDLERLRIGIKKIRSSPQSNAKFKTMSQSDLTPILDVPTRWNSTADMLQRALELKDGLIAYFCSYDSVQSSADERISLKPESWGDFERILMYLVPFKRYTELICGEKYSTLSLVVPLYNKLIDHLRLWMNSKTTPGERLHNSTVAALEKITRYYNVTSDCYTVCTVLDPRLGLKYYNLAQDRGNENTSVIFDAVNDVYQKCYAPDPSAIAEPVVRIDEYDPFPAENIIEDELKSFTQRTDRLKGENADILAWWKSQSETYPNLSKMARDYLAIPATSTSSERLFSSGKHLITDSRNSLCAETIQACQCLKSWNKL